MAAAYVAAKGLQMARLEIAVTTLEDARRAREGGADSVEVSENLAVGGLTPGLHIIRSICKLAPLDIHVIVRPHAKSFVYSAGDMAVILRDTVCLVRLGVTSVVFGACDAEGRLDLRLIGEVQRAASPAALTVHRAIDESVEPEKSLEGLAKMGLHRVLTAGPAKNAWDGRAGLANWVKRFGDRISFVVSGGLRVEQLPELTQQVNAPEYHFGSAARTNDAVDVEKVRALRAALPK